MQNSLLDNLKGHANIKSLTVKKVYVNSPNTTKAYTQFTQDLKEDKDFKEFKKNAGFAELGVVVAGRLYHTIELAHK